MERPIFIEFTKLNDSKILVNTNTISAIEEINYNEDNIATKVIFNNMETYVKESISDIEQLLNRFTSCI